MAVHRSVRLWLWAGVIMVFIQVLLGGITRLTGSGLSITKWDIVTGTIPPLNQAQWNSEFDLYKQTPQYQHINEGMTLRQFKFIYFWEYFHRLWARTIGFVFLIPFVFFLIRRRITRPLLRDLGIAVALGALVATFGWIMVASGLVDRPWVNAYKLTIHLNLALILYAWLVWVALGSQAHKARDRQIKAWLTGLTILLGIQFFLGGIMSGMKAGLYYPTWPDMYGEFFPSALMDPELWTGYFLFEAYERGPVPGMVQFLHRMTAYLILLILSLTIYKSIKNRFNKFAIRYLYIFLGIVVFQVLLGILTVVHCQGKVPLFLGVAHQGLAIVLLTALVFLHRKIAR